MYRLAIFSLHSSASWALRCSIFGLLGLFLVSFGGSTSDNVKGDEPAVGTVSPRDKMVVETVLRLKDFDLESSPPAKAALMRYLKAQPGSEQYFQLVKRFQLTDLTADLLELAFAHAEETVGAQAAEALFQFQQESSLLEAASGLDVDRATAAVKLIGYAGGARAIELLMPLIQNAAVDAAPRAAAVSALGKRADGQEAILQLVIADGLPEDVRFAAANALLGSVDPAIRQRAADHLQLPETADNMPLPTVAELVQRRGDPAAGKLVFQTVGTCNKCHQVHGEGKQIGPDLSEIGSKLSREAMYTEILDPSFSISHNYETYTLLSDSGETVTGLLVSQTDDSVSLKTIDGIVRSIPTNQLEDMKKQPVSLMPQDLQRLMTIQQLIDLVEYSLSLKAVNPPQPAK